MTTATRYISADGSLIAEPGAYDIVDTVVHVTSTRKSNGIAVSEQDATIIHTLAPKVEAEPVEVDWRARAEKAEATLAAVVEQFAATFEPDFGGVDWKDDAAIQRFATNCIRIIHANAATPSGALSLKVGTP